MYQSNMHDNNGLFAPGMTGTMGIVKNAGKCNKNSRSLSTAFRVVVIFKRLF